MNKKPSPKRRLWCGDRRCFPVRMSIRAKRLAQQLRTRNARPYADNGYFSFNCDKNKTVFAIPTVYLTMSFRPSGAKRNAWRNLLGGEPWFPVREISRLFAARIRLTPTARNDMYRKRVNLSLRSRQLTQKSGQGAYLTACKTINHKSKFINQSRLIKAHPTYLPARRFLYCAGVQW